LTAKRLYFYLTVERLIKRDKTHTDSTYFSAGQFFTAIDFLYHPIFPKCRLPNISGFSQHVGKKQAFFGWPNLPPKFLNAFTANGFSRFCIDPFFFWHAGWLTGQVKPKIV
jgi:hypothetical protein